MAQLSHMFTALLLALPNKAVKYFLLAEYPRGSTQQSKPCQTKLQTRLHLCCVTPGLLASRPLLAQRASPAAQSAQGHTRSTEAAKGSCLWKGLSAPHCISHGSSWLVTCLPALPHSSLSASTSGWPWSLCLHTLETLISETSLLRHHPILTL